jgi:diaminohydroxyphosphoribosylaminopyrimidine deaminase/5-amino-6-(5-phosphoribosylamino)uracil reductase
MNTDEHWMDLAVSLAKATIGQTSPNPSVGSVIVRDGELVGVGTHLQAGTAHAEIHALSQAGSKAEGATIYVTLEPCSHYGRTPPCTDQIIRAGIKRVVIGQVDLDSRVSGRGINKLKAHGIEVITGVKSKECFRLNEPYFWHRTYKRPFVTLKMATTLDGKIATANGHSRYVTGEDARKDVHLLRHQHDAILVGSGTALVDNPQLTVRLLTGGKNPIRIILDSKLRLPTNYHLADTSQAETWIFTTKEKNPKREQELLAKGVKIFTVDSNTIDWDFVLTTLGKHNILSVLVEGGSTISASLLQENQVNRVIQYIAPKYLGGRNSRSAVEGKNPVQMTEALPLEDIEVEKIGDDLKITGWRKRGESLCFPES